METDIQIEIERIKKALEENPGRGLPTEEFSDLPKAAVSLLLKPDQQGRQLLLLVLKRQVSESDPWSGQIALPGGRARNDEQLLDTVRREMMEEVAIDSKKCELLGTLDELLPGSRSIIVTPFVFLAPESTEALIDTREIAEYVWIPINFFLDKRNSATLKVERSGRSFEMPSFPYLGTHIVWGMTLRIIQDYISKIESTTSSQLK